MDDHVEVGGTGTVHVEPDQAVLRLRLVGRAEDVAGALASLTDVVAAVLADLDVAGVPPQQRQTSSLDVDQDWDEGSGRRRGYAASQGLTLRLAEAARAGEVVSRVAALAGSALRVDGIGWASSEAGAARVRAREAAWSDARATAEQLAGLAGRGLGEVVHVRELPASHEDGGGYARAASFEAQEALPTAPGSTSESVALHVRWRLR